MSAPGLKITNFHYSNMKMPEPNLTEYPKWVYMDGYPGILSQNAEEEAQLLARPSKAKTDKPLVAEAPKAPEPMPTKSAPILSGPNDEREILLQIAKEKNIKIDARWKTDRIRATIERETQGQ